MSDSLPDDPFDLADSPAFRPARRRSLRVFGAPVELVLLPERRTRTGAPTARREPYGRDVVPRILEQETVWRNRGCAMTPNRHPIAAREVLLWAEDPVRELPLPVLEIAFGLEEATSGAVTINTIGSAASIPRAHAHLMGERLPFLEAMPTERFEPDYLAHVEGVEVVRLAAPFPTLALGLRGGAVARARAVHALQQICTTPAHNVVAQGGTAWVFPHSAVEIPAPWFPTALGAAELWGRWCYDDDETFDAATGDGLERAIELAGFALSE